MNQFHGNPEPPRDLGPLEQPDERSTVSGIRKRKMLVFNGPEDCPKGVTLERSSDGFIATAPYSNFAIGALFGLIGIGCIVMMLSSIGKDNVPATWLPIMSVIALAMFLCGAALSFAKAVLILDGEWVHFRRKFLGMSFGRHISMTKLKRLSITKEQIMVGHPRLRTRSRRLPKIRIETADRNWEFGVNLSDARQQYFRYLIELHYKTWKKKQD